MLYPRIFHHGTLAGVTDSCHVLCAEAEVSFTIDCGLFQRADSSSSVKAGQDALRIELLLRTLRAMVATHAHIEHVGRIPYLLAARFRGLCSEPSATLLLILLEEAFKLGISRTQKEVERYIALVQRIIAVPYNLLFSGDLGAPPAPLLPAPRPPYGADILVVESSDGDRQRENRLTQRQRLKHAIDQALDHNDTVFIHAFSTGRIQELLYKKIDRRARTTPAEEGALGVMSARMHLNLKPGRLNSPSFSTRHWPAVSPQPTGSCSLSGTRNRPGV